MRKIRNPISNTEFRDFTRGKALDGDPLSLVHTTDMLALEQIQTDGEIKPVKTCTNYSEPLIYAFYGRPSYRVHPDVRNTRISAFAPVCFVFRRSMPWRAKRIHGFDTGAFCKDLMHQVMHPDFAADDFEVDPTVDGVKSLVGTFYANEKDYLDGNPTSTLDEEQIAKERLYRVEAYNQLIRYVQNDGTDERIHSIEIQRDIPITLKGNLLAVIYPAKFISDERKKSLAKDWGCKMVHYNVRSVFSPADLMSVIFDKVREVLLDDEQIS